MSAVLEETTVMSAPLSIPYPLPTATLHPGRAPRTRFPAFAAAHFPHLPPRWQLRVFCPNSVQNFAIRGHDTESAVGVRMKHLAATRMGASSVFAMP
eukprot:3934350-Rhodomonas_salina.1